MKKILVILVGAAMIMVSSTAMALPMINGTIDIAGGSNLTSTLGTVTFANAQAIDFTDQNGLVVSRTGDFATVALGTQATLMDFAFAPLNPNPVAPLWKIDSPFFSFDLYTISVTRNALSLELSGTGVVHGAGFADTPGLWDLTTQSSGGDAIFALSFSQNTIARPVPEPATMLLLGLGLVGIAGTRRKMHI